MIISKYFPFYFILIFHLLICYLFSFLLSAKFLYIVYSNDKVMIKKKKNTISTQSFMLWEYLADFKISRF